MPGCFSEVNSNSCETALSPTLERATKTAYHAPVLLL